MEPTYIQDITAPLTTSSATQITARRENLRQAVAAEESSPDRLNVSNRYGNPPIQAAVVPWCSAVANTRAGRCSRRPAAWLVMTTALHGMAARIGNAQLLREAERLVRSAITREAPAAAEPARKKLAPGSS